MSDWVLLVFIYDFKDCVGSCVVRVKALYMCLIGGW